MSTNSIILKHSVELRYYFIKHDNVDRIKFLIYARFDLDIIVGPVNEGCYQTL